MQIFLFIFGMMPSKPHVTSSTAFQPLFSKINLHLRHCSTHLLTTLFSKFSSVLVGQIFVLTIPINFNPVLFNVVFWATVFVIKVINVFMSHLVVYTFLEKLSSKSQFFPFKSPILPSHFPGLLLQLLPQILHQFLDLIPLCYSTCLPLGSSTEAQRPKHSHGLPHIPHSKNRLESFISITNRPKPRPKPTPKPKHTPRIPNSLPFTSVSQFFP